MLGRYAKNTTSMKISPISILYSVFNTWATLRGKFIIFNYSRLDLNDEYLMFEVAEIIEQKYNLNDTSKCVMRLNKASQELRFIAPLARYINEVTNGGHHQFFWNTDGVYNDLVMTGINYYECNNLADNFKKALNTFKEDATMHEEDYESLKDMTKKFSTSAKLDNYELFDNTFFESESQLQNTINQSIRKNA
jgi:hypothetical protein